MTYVGPYVLCNIGHITYILELGLITDNHLQGRPTCAVC